MVGIYVSRIGNPHNWEGTMNVRILKLLNLHKQIAQFVGCNVKDVVFVILNDVIEGNEAISDGGFACIRNTHKTKLENKSIDALNLTFKQTKQHTKQPLNRNKENKECKTLSIQWTHGGQFEDTNIHVDWHELLHICRTFWIHLFLLKYAQRANSNGKKLLSIDKNFSPLEYSPCN